MRNCVRVLLLAAALSAAPGAGAATIEAAQPESQKQVLVLYSTRRDTQIVTTGERELPRLLEQGLGGAFDYYSEFIERARFPDQSYRDAFADFLRKKYLGHRFDVVIAVQDAAYEFMSDERDALFPDVPLVFAMNAPVTRRIRNSTGIITPLDLAGSLKLAMDLQPDVRNVFVVSGADRSDVAMERTAREELQQFSRQVAISYLSGLRTTELERRLGALPPRSLVYYMLVNQDGNGEYFNPLEYLERVSAAANAPVYCWVDSTLGHGIAGGRLRRQAGVMEELGRAALRVLGGETAESIPVSSVDINVDQVDWRQLRRWRISEARAPVGTTVLFRDPSPWDRYRVQIVTGLTVLLAQTALIAGLLVQSARRRRAEERMRRSESALRTSYERIHDLGGRLLQAQETERSRIARELHDDISQQLALLTVDLETIHQAPDADLDELTADVLGRTRSIARSVHALSHRLHPARLRLIGLVAALEALRREMAQPGVEIAFTHANVPQGLDDDLTVAVYRVAQEALGNALKYSRGRRIALDLTADAQTLGLTVADDGVGFDAQTAWGKGIGMITMRERLEALGGTLDVRSKPGAGTRLDGRVPLRAAAAAERATA